MIFHRLECKGLAQYSYLVGDDGIGFVIDPMRDVGVYQDLAIKNGLVITDIFETHRHEDYLSGAQELASITGADIHVSGHDDLIYAFGNEIHHGDEFEFGSFILKAIHTPGHTLGHLSFALYEAGRNSPYMVFTGDTLFFGDLGRTDFYGSRDLEKMTGLLYDSLYKLIKPLGDEVLLMPGHGQGSACGETMENRPYSTIGYEFQHNPKLQYSTKEDFIEGFGKMRIKPRYFENMEMANLQGQAFIGSKHRLIPFYYDEIEDEDLIIDLRSAQAFMACHIPGSIYLNPSTFASYLGSLFDSSRDIILMADKNRMDLVEEAYWDGLRIGFDNIIGFLSDGLEDYYTAGYKDQVLKSISPSAYLAIDSPLTLDVRMVNSLEEIGQDGSVYKIPLKILAEEFQILPKDKVLYLICDSGNLATTAGSYLLAKGYDVVVVRGGAKAIKALEGNEY